MTSINVMPTAVSPEAVALRGRAHEIIPGGCHTYAKGDDQYPANAPPFILRGEGSHVWDLDGNEFIEYGMGLRAVALGHAFPSVTEAVAKELENGSNFSRPSPLEVECAELFLECVTNAEMVKFAKNGSDATTAAVKLARAYTGRDLVAICADQPFFSTDDWFIGSTRMPAGVPQAIRQLTVKFGFNDIQSLESVFAAHPEQIACVFLEAETAVAPRDGFLEAVREICDRHGALLVLDETITGFRWHLGGAQTVYGVVPDLSTFGKAMANGFAVAALAGKRQIMERGGLSGSAERVFLLSTTHGAETHSLAAAIATMRTFQSEPVIDTLHRQGDSLRAQVDQVARRHGLEDFLQVRGRSSNLIFVTKGPDGNPSQAYRALFMQEMIRQGVIAPSFVLSYSHSDSDIERTIDAVDSAAEIYVRALNEGIDGHLVGRPVKPVFRPFN